MKNKFLYLLLSLPLLFTSCKKDTDVSIESDGGVDETSPSIIEETVNDNINYTADTEYVNPVDNILNNAEVYLLSASTYTSVLTTTTKSPVINFSYIYDSDYYYTDKFHGKVSTITINNIDTNLFSIDTNFIDNNTVVIEDIFDIDNETSYSRYVLNDVSSEWDTLRDVFNITEEYTPFYLINICFEYLSYYGKVIDNTTISCDNVEMWSGYSTITGYFDDNYTPLRFTINYKSGNLETIFDLTISNIDSLDSSFNMPEISSETDEDENNSIYSYLLSKLYSYATGNFDERIMITEDYFYYGVEDEEDFIIDNIPMDIVGSDYFYFDKIDSDNIIIEDNCHKYEDNYYCLTLSIDDTKAELIADIAEALKHNEYYPSLSFGYFNIGGSNRYDFLDTIPYHIEEYDDYLELNLENAIDYKFYIDEDMGCYKVDVVWKLKNNDTTELVEETYESDAISYEDE